MKKITFLLQALVFGGAINVKAQTFDLNYGTNNGAAIFSLGAAAETPKNAAIHAPSGRLYIAASTDLDADEAFSKNGVLICFNEQGQRENSFDGDGYLIFDSPGKSDEFNGVSIQPDGKIVVVGHSGFYPTVWRFNSNGTLDNTFGNAGMRSLPEVGILKSCLIQPDGKIVASGQGYLASGNTSLASYLVARFLPNGNPDINFNGTGFIEHRTGTSTSEKDEGAGESVVLQPDGKIVTCGFSTSFTGENASIIRVNSNGTIDNTFSNDGVWVSAFPNEDRFYDLKVHNGNIILCGYQRVNDSNYKLMAVRLNSVGNFDNSFGGVGLVFYDPSGNAADLFQSIVVSENGSYIMGGRVNTKATLMRIKNNGEQDNTFGFNGFLSYQAGNYSTFIHIVQNGSCLYPVGVFNPPSSFLDDEVFATTTCVVGLSNQEETLADVSVFDVFPNPTSNSWNVKGDFGQSAFIEIFDMQGRSMVTQRVENTGVSSIEIEAASQFPPGIYRMIVRTDQKVQSKLLSKV
jgi:uncharacterized delta-60 repeat protein